MKARFLIADLNFPSRFFLTCFLLISCFSHPAFSDELDQNVLLDFQTHSYYWAFNGPTAKDSEVIDELLNSASALSEALGIGYRDEIKVLMKRDVNAQGGPQLLLSSRTIRIF